MNLEMKFIKTGRKLTHRDIDKIQKTIGADIPKEYSDFLLLNNGGETEEEMLFDFFDEVTESDNTSVIREFFSVNGKTLDLITVYDNLVNSQSMSSKMIAIADDPGGNVIGISLEQDDYGTVYYLNHEYEEIDTGYLLKSKISSSFAEFLKMLYLDIEE